MPIDRDSVVAHGVRYTGQVEEEDKTDKAMKPSIVPPTALVLFMLLLGYE